MSNLVKLVGLNKSEHLNIDFNSDLDKLVGTIKEHLMNYFHCSKETN